MARQMSTTVIITGKGKGEFEEDGAAYYMQRSQSDTEMVTKWVLSVREQRVAETETRFEVRYGFNFLILVWQIQDQGDASEVSALGAKFKKAQ